jgi:hypothetical protein
MQINFKSLLPHITAIGLFLLVAIIYFLPAIKGMALHQGDIDNFLGASKEIVDFRNKFHKEPLWTNGIFAGMPAFQVSTLYPGNLVQYIFTALLYTLPFPIGIVFLYFFGFYILLKVLYVDSWVAIVGSFAFGFSSFFFIVLEAGHNSEANAIGFMAPVLAGVILSFNGKRLLGGALTALALALELYASHLQITYYLFLIILIYGITQLIIAIKNKQLPGYFKTVGVLVIASLLAISTNITNLWLTYEYGKYSTRGKSDLTINSTQNKSSGLAIDYATQWSYGIPETMTLIMPDFVGGASEPIGVMSKSALDGIDPQHRQAVAQSYQYWGEQSITSGPVYAGAIVCFLALMGLFLIKGPMKWFLLIPTILSIMLAWGKNFMWFTELFFYHFPGYNKFRSVTMILVIAELTIPLLATLALDMIIKNRALLDEKISLRFFGDKVAVKKIFFASVILTAGIALLCFIMPGAFSSFHRSNESATLVQEIKQGNPGVSDQQIQSYVDETMPFVEQARKKIFTEDAIRTAIFILLAAGLIWVYYKKLVDRKITIAVLLFFLVMDMYNVNKRYLNDRSFVSKSSAKEPFQPDAADLQILQDSSLDYRVYNTMARPDQDSRTSYFHKSLGGYSGVKMKRYDELLNQIEGGNMAVIDMLNTKYVIVGTKEGQPQAQRNPGALGNAWFVNNYKLVPNADSEYTGLMRFNPAQTAIIDQQFTGYIANKHIVPDSNASIKLISYEPNDLVYTAQTHSEQLAVFSEIYYRDGWDAFVDGTPADYIRTNYILRAMFIPAGNHKVEFKFEPKQYATGEKISFASSLVLLLGCLALLIQQLRKPQES